MATPPKIKVIWEFIEDPASDELLYQAFRIILGDEIGLVREQELTKKQSSVRMKTSPPQPH
jgi:hypothetical protein